MEEKNEIKIRDDLNNIVKDIQFGIEKNRYGNEKKVCSIVLYNNDTITIADTEGICDIISTYGKLGKKCIGSKKLVEEIRKNFTEEDKSPTYMCVLVTLIDGSEFRLFPSNRADKIRLNAYYEAYKQANQPKKAN